MIISKTVSLKKNIIQYVLETTNPEHTVFVLPTFKNKSDALLKFQSNWNFTDTSFYSFAEFKSLFFESEYPVISSDKRKILLYSILDEKLKTELRLKDYFSAIGFMDNFFTFWEEILDECLDPEKLIDTLENNSGSLLFESQRDFYDLIFNLLRRYEKKLADTGFSDNIFLINEKNISFPVSLKGKEKFVFVNQYYFSNLEEKLLKTLSINGKNCVKVNQFTSEQNEDNVEEISFENPENLRIQNIEIIEVPDSYSMYLEFLQHYNKDNIILNNSTVTDEITSILKEKFRMGENTCREAVLYNFLKNLVNLVENANLAGDRSTLIFSLESMRSFFSANSKYKLFKDPVEKYHHTLSDRLTLFYLQNSFLSISFDKLKNTFSNDAEMIGVLEFYEKIIDMLLAEDISLSKFFDYLFTCADFGLDRNEWQSFWRSYYDLESTYSADFPVDIDRLFEVNTCLNHLKLFLDIYKTDSSANSKTESLEFTSLNNTRNIFPKSKVIVLHAEEGIIPSNPKKQFLFNDSQRKSLGLKTYEHIREREKYYFYRLIANAESAVIICINNIEKDISVSSFIENVKFYLTNNSSIEFSFRKSNIFSQRFHETLEMISSESKLSERKKTGLIIPFEKAVFFRNNEIKISPTSYKILNENPIDYYFKSILRLSPLKWKPENIITPLAFGIIFHEIMNAVFSDIRDGKRFQSNTLFRKDELNILINKALSEILSLSHETELIYNIPGNMSLDFYKTHVIPFIIDSVRIFINALNELVKVSAENIPAIFTEGEFAPEKETNGVELVNCPNYRVFIRGRADLILYSEYYNSYFIIDFKSAEQKTKYEKDYSQQLEIYKFLYFSKNGRIDFKGEIYRMLMFLMDHSQKVNSDMDSDLQEKIKNFFDKLLVVENLIPPESSSKIDNDFKELYRI